MLCWTYFYKFVTWPQIMIFNWFLTGIIIYNILLKNFKN